jgi:hypothetical protein
MKIIIFLIGMIVGVFIGAIHLGDKLVDFCEKDGKFLAINGKTYICK